MADDRAAWVNAGGFERGTDPVGPFGQLPVRAIVNRRPPGVGRDQAEQHPQGRGLASTVAAEESDDATGLDYKAEIVHCKHRAEPLGQPLGFDHCQGRPSPSLGRPG